MRLLAPLLPVLLAGLLAVPISTGSEEMRPASPLRLPGRCGLCHPDRVDPSPDGAFNYLQLRRDTFSGGRGMCYSCHNGPVRDSRRRIWSGNQHASGGTSSELRAGLGASCGTCHTPHGTAEGISVFMRFGKDSFAFCLGCHPGRSGDRPGEHPPARPGKEGGLREAPSCGACHGMHRAPGKALLVRSGGKALCIRCHEENPSKEGKGPGTASHPVGGESPSCRDCHLLHRAEGADLLRPEMSESAFCVRCHEEHAGTVSGEGNHILLPGAVTCVSCHRLHNAATAGMDKGFLLSGISGREEPCRTCHDALAADRSRWSHPIGLPASGASPARLRNLTRYGGLLGPEEEILCLTCHRSHGALEGRDMLVIRREALCLYCHDDQNSLAWESSPAGNHPVSVRPREAALPEPFRAAGNDRLTCLSCHRAHRGAAGTPGLAVPEEQFDCTLCHQEPPGFAASAHGGGDEASACRSCHGYHRWNVDPDSVTMGGTATDKLCWACHGLEGSAPLNRYFGHIIGVPAPEASGAGVLPLYREDGKPSLAGLIGCPTCHDVHRGGGEGLLRIARGERVSGMCLACHPQQESVTGTRHDLSERLPQEKNRLGEEASRTGPCGVCHLVHTESPGQPWARTIPERSPAGSGLSLCVSCHSAGEPAAALVVPETGHPSSALLETDPGTKIIGCEGCHDPHQWDPSDPARRGKSDADGDFSNSFLISPANGSSELCRSCHLPESAVAGTKHDLPEEDGKGLCGSCHVPHGGDPLHLWPSVLPEKDTYGAGTCLTCHWERGFPPDDGTERSQHPMGVFSVPGSPEKFPLYNAAGRPHPQGKIACGTCHDPHRWSPLIGEPSDPAEPGTPATSFLREAADSFAPLCQGCHWEQSAVVGTDHDLRVTAPESRNLKGETADESGACGACHRTHDARGFPLWNRVPGRGEDPQSRACRSCHEEAGTGGGSVPPRLETHLVAYPGKGMVSRPFRRTSSFVAPDYPTLRLYDREGEEKNRGFISCASCHDPHLWKPGARGPGAGMPMDGDLSNSFLKVQDNFAVTRFFCRNCHGEEALEYYQRYHTPAGWSAETGQGR